MLEVNKIHNADCLDILKELPDKCIDLVLTDPPYTFNVGGFANKRKSYEEMKKWTNTNINWYNDTFLKELCRISKKCNIVLFCQTGNLFNILNFVNYNNLKYSLLPILKNNPAPLTNKTWLANEYAISIYNKAIILNKDYHLKIPYFFVGNEKQTDHPNEKNINIIKRIIKNITNQNDLVLDCFSGSGTTAIACHNLKRRFICIEKNYDYWKASVERLKDAQSQLKLF